MLINFLPNDKFWTCQIQSISRQQNNSDSEIEIVLGRVENIVEKGENAGY